MPVEDPTTPHWWACHSIIAPSSSNSPLHHVVLNRGVGSGCTRHWGLVIFAAPFIFRWITMLTIGRRLCCRPPHAFSKSMVCYSTPHHQLRRSSSKQSFCMPLVLSFPPLHHEPSTSYLPRPLQSFFFSRVARHLRGRLKKKWDLGLLPWLPLPTPLPHSLSCSYIFFLLIFHLLRWRLTLSLDLFRPSIFILWLNPCETIPRLTPI